MSERIERAVLLAACLFMPAYYGALLTGGDFALLRPTAQGLTFNSMLTHLLAGRFDVDPGIVGLEGFLRDGHVYAYWGIFGALLRLPLLLRPGAIAIDITTLSCLAGVCLGGAFKLATLLLVSRHCPRSPDRTLLVASFGLWLLLGGAQIGFLRAMIYQEVTFWAGAFSAIFLYAAIRALLRGQFSPATWAVMAAMAGLAVNTRISTGIGLCVALGLLMAVRLHQRATPPQDRQPIPALLLPAAILALFLAVAAIVNIGRWGSPLIFADYSHYLMNARYPDRMPRTLAYGLFNLRRIPLGLIYYFLPVWVLHGPDGTLLLDAWRTRLLDSAELPPASFLLTDRLPFLLVGLCCTCTGLLRPWPALRPWSTLGAQVIAVAAGLAVPAGLMLTAIAMNYRYRLDFYPLWEFAGFIAILALSHRHASTGMAISTRRLVLAAAITGIIAAHGFLLLYRLSALGPGQDSLHAGVFEFYRSAFENRRFR